MNFHSAKSKFSIFLWWYYQSFHRFFPLRTIPFEWCSFIFIKFKYISIERDCAEGKICEKIENSTLIRLNIYSLQSETSLITVWDFTHINDFHSWKIELSIEKIDLKSHSKEDWLFHSLEFREYVWKFTQKHHSTRQCTQWRSASMHTQPPNWDNVTVNIALYWKRVNKVFFFFFLFFQRARIA